MLWLGLSENASTWEPESSLPSTLVENFQAGITTEADALTEKLYGCTSTILTVASQPPAAKRPMIERLCKAEVEG